MQLSSLPAELIESIAEQVALQSGLDLLCLSRTCSSLRSAARRVGRAEVQQHVRELSGRVPPSGKKVSLTRSALLDSCVKDMPTLDLPILRAQEHNSQQHQPEPDEMLLRNFASDRFHRPHTRYEFSSSLFLGKVLDRSVRLWDLLEYPPKVVELDLARPLIHSTSWLDDVVCKELDHQGYDSYPCLQLQAITLGEVRVVLAQTFLQRSLHLIDACGRPYLNYTLSMHKKVEESFQQGRVKLYKRGSAARGRAGAPTATPGSKPFIRQAGRPGHAERFAVWDYMWRAARLPRRRTGGADSPGVLFYHLPLHSKHVEWVLLLARPDRDSSETITSGTIDLAWLTSAESPCANEFRSRELSLEVLEPRSDGGPYIVQALWQEWSQDAVSQQSATPDGVRLVHFSLEDVSSLASRQESSRSRVASALIPIAIEKLSSARQHFCLSKDGLRLFLFVPTLPSETRGTLIVYSRPRCDTAWREESKDPYLSKNDRILGSFAQWLVLADETTGLVNVRRMDAAAAQLETFQLHTQRNHHFLEMYKGPLLISILAGRVVLRTKDGLVSGILDLTTEAGPSRVKLHKMISKRLAKHHEPPKDDRRHGMTDELRRYIQEDDSDWKDVYKDSCMLYCHGDPDPNSNEHNLCLDYFDREASSRPLVLYICDEEEYILRGSYALQLHSHSAKIESVWQAPDDDARFHFYDRPVFQGVAPGQILLDYANDNVMAEETVVVDFAAGRALTVNFPRVAPVLGRWTDGAAARSLLLFRSPQPLDPHRPRHCWFYVSQGPTRARRKRQKEARIKAWEAELYGEGERQTRYPAPASVESRPLNSSLPLLDKTTRNSTNRIRKIGIIKTKRRKAKGRTRSMMKTPKWTPDRTGSWKMLRQTTIRLRHGPRSSKPSTSKDQFET